MDMIRATLGAQRINFYGYSYGSYLGQVYGTMFPERVRRMVLDSNVDPNSWWYEAGPNQTRGFDRNINTWFRWLAKYHAVYDLGRTGKAVRALFLGQKAKLRKQPAGGKIGPNEWIDIFSLGAGSARSRWAYLGELFAGWVHEGHWTPLKTEYDSVNSPMDDNFYAALLSVLCTDAPSPKTWGEVAADTWRLHNAAPITAWRRTWFSGPCLYWRAPAHRSVEVDGSGVNSVLLIGETRDAATPFEGSLAVRALFPNSSLIAGVDGTTHGASLSGNTCVDNRVAAYLATGTRPARQPGRRADVACPPLQPPVP
jgi:pimeloyl-ACP methyl ester carboxylesterase